jgi:hypothetical protein
MFPRAPLLQVSAILEAYRFSSRKGTPTLQKLDQVKTLRCTSIFCHKVQPASRRMPASCLENKLFYRPLTLGCTLIVSARCGCAAGSET